MSRPRPSRALDDTRRGSRTADFAERIRVHNALRAHSAADPTTTADLAQETGLDGRVIRACFGLDDAEDYILGGGDDGVFLAEYREDAERMTDRLEAHARAELHRVERRRRYEATMPRRQETFGF